jgi:hypothetical protein
MAAGPGDGGAEAARAAVAEALRALEAARAVLADPGPGSGDDLHDALAALEAARTARARVEGAVARLASRAMRLGASPVALGIGFDDRL